MLRLLPIATLLLSLLAIQATAAEIALLTEITWDEFAPTTGKAAQAAEWKQQLADFDKAAANSKPVGAEP